MIDVVLYAVVEDGKILLEKRKDDEERYPSLWAIPSGHVEMEDKVSALMREVNEETGLMPLKYMLLKTMPSDDGKSLLHIFVITEFAGETKQETDEGRKLQWFSVEDARKVLTDGDFHNTTGLILAEVEKVVSSQK